MLKSVVIHNLGPIDALSWTAVGPGLNAIIGANDTGKTLLLKMLYVCVRSAEDYRRGDDTRTIRQILDDKLTWTFQLPRIGDLVRKGQEQPLSVRMSGRGSDSPLDLEFSFSHRARKGVGEVTSTLPRLESTSLFIPAKEVLSMMGAIKESRQAQKFGFDDPTYDLVLAIEREPSRGPPPFGNARREIERLIKGRVIERNGEWSFQRANKRYPVAITAEGIKKIAILDRLIVNRSLRESSVLFVDEPESFLHPTALVRFLDVLAILATHGMQIFLATHSLIALRKVALLAKGQHSPVPLLDLEHRNADTPQIHDLRDGLPPNAISEESARLYEQEIFGHPEQP